MPGTIAKLVKPTGLEELLQQAQERRKVADQLGQLSTSTAPVGSWTQVLAQLMQGFVAGRENKKADSLESDYSKKLSDQFATHTAGFMADAKLLTPQQLVAKYNGDPMVAELVKPFQDGLSEGAKQGQEIVDTPSLGYKRKGDLVDTGAMTDYNKRIIPDPDHPGRFIINPLEVGAAQASQVVPADNQSIKAIMGESFGPGGLSTSAPADSASPAPQGNGFTPSNIGQVESGNRDFLPNGQPVTSPKGAMYGMQVMPSTAAQPGFGVQPVPPNIMALSPTDPRRAAAFDQVGNNYAAAMRARYGNSPAASAAYNAGPGAVNRSIAANGTNFLSSLPSETQRYTQHFGTGTKPPDGIATDGRPYWMINGQAFDNPDGR